MSNDAEGGNVVPGRGREGEESAEEAFRRRGGFFFDFLSYSTKTVRSIKSFQTKFTRNRKLVPPSPVRFNDPAMWDYDNFPSVRGRYTRVNYVSDKIYIPFKYIYIYASVDNNF